MPVTAEHREQYRQWLLDRELQPDVAAAILESMPPFDWSEIARRSDLAEVEGRLDKRLDGVDKRLNGVDKRLDGIDTRLDRMDTRLDGMGARLDLVDSQLGMLNDRVGRVEDGLLSLGERIASLHQAVMFQGVGLIITLILGFSAVFTGLILSI